LTLKTKEHLEQKDLNSFETLVLHSKIQKLDVSLSCDPIGESIIEKAIEKNKFINNLYLNYHDTHKRKKIYFDFIKENETLTDLNIFGLDRCEDAIQDILEAMKKNKSIQVLDYNLGLNYKIQFNFEDFSFLKENKSLKKLTIDSLNFPEFFFNFLWNSCYS